MKVLVTGFDPFGGEKVNPAYEAVKLLPDTIAGAEIIKIEIPTVFTRSAEVLEEAIQKYRPDVVLDVGQAGIFFHASGKSNGREYESTWNSGSHLLHSRNICM